MSWRASIRGPRRSCRASTRISARRSCRRFSRSRARSGTRAPAARAPLPPGGRPSNATRVSGEDRRSCLSSFFHNLLEALLLRGYEPAHVALQEQRIDEKTERSVPIERVTHERSAVACVKLVNVAEALERAAHHLIHEDARPIELGDSRREALSDSEVPSFERHEISELEEAGKAARFDDALVRERGAARVRIHIAR